MVPRQPDLSLNPTVADQVATGTDAILASPHVSEGPGRIANAPVPSVFVREPYETVKALTVVVS